MTEKKVTEKKVATKATVKKATTRKTTAKKVVAPVEVSAECVGFRAGDVYQALSVAQAGLSIAEIAKAAGISAEETLLGMGWLLKEGKIKGEGDKVFLA